MKKYKVNREDENLPDDEEIRKYKDFGRLRYNYEKITKPPKKPLYKDPRSFLGLLLIVIIVYIVSMESDPDSGASEQEDSTKDTTTQVDQ